MKNKSRIRLIISMPILVTLICFLTVNEIKSRYEKNIAEEFLNKISMVQQSHGNLPFMMSDVEGGGWDLVCTSFEVDNSYPVAPTHKIIESGGWNTSHWTQRFPRVSYINWLTSLAHIYDQEYKYAFIFIKNDTVVKVVKSYQGDFVSKMGEGSCLRDIKFTPTNETFLGINRTFLQVSRGDK